MIPQDSDLEFKRIKFDVKFIDDGARSDAYEFKAIATTFGNSDREGDIIKSGAFSEGLRSVTPKLLWQHRFDEPIGTIKNIDVNDERISFTGSMPKSDEFVTNRVMPQLKHGTLDISIGFFAHEIERDGETKIITRGTLFEFSLVSIPANPRAVVTDVKTIASFADLPIGDGDEADAGFLEEIDGEKVLPITKGGFAIPKALFKAAAIVQMRKETHSKTTGHIARYYAKMGRENPFSKGFSPDEIKSLSRGDLVKFLRSQPLLSKSGAEYISQGIMGGPGKVADTQADGLRCLSDTLSHLKKDSSNG